MRKVTRPGEAPAWTHRLLGGGVTGSSGACCWPVRVLDTEMLWATCRIAVPLKVAVSIHLLDRIATWYFLRLRPTRWRETSALAAGPRRAAQRSDRGTRAAAERRPDRRAFCFGPDACWRHVIAGARVRQA